MLLLQRRTIRRLGSLGSCSPIFFTYFKRGKLLGPPSLVKLQSRKCADFVAKIPLLVLNVF